MHVYIRVYLQLIASKTSKKVIKTKSELDVL